MDKKQFSFEITHQSNENSARLGIIRTPHGDIHTPALIPVGTQATVKSLTPKEIQDVGTQLFFVNTYHMAIRPGIDVVKKMGGLHQFMNWDGPIITDSGGFQVFSLGNFRHSGKRVSERVQNQNTDPGQARMTKQRIEDGIPDLVKITENGVKFRSHWDGQYHEFSPEISMQYQWDLGSDIHIAFDDCTAYPVTHEEAKKSMERTHCWAVRSLNEHKEISNSCHSREGPLRLSEVSGNPSAVFSPTTMDPRGSLPSTLIGGRDDNYLYQALYGSIQGSIFEDLRRESAKFISSMDFDGIAIGGVSVGESKEQMKNVLDWVMPLLPPEKPRHLLGVGEIDDIFSLIEHGIDTFDCVQPTRLARVGYVYTNSKVKTQNSKFFIDINKSIFTEDPGPIDKNCLCYTCKNFSRAYIHHLFTVRELLAYRLATIHNLSFVHRFVFDIRLAIASNTFLELRHKWLYTTPL